MHKKLAMTSSRIRHCADRKKAQTESEMFVDQQLSHVITWYRMVTWFEPFLFAYLLTYLSEYRKHDIITVTHWRSGRWLTIHRTYLDRHHQQNHLINCTDQQQQQPQRLLARRHSCNLSRGSAPPSTVDLLDVPRGDMASVLNDGRNTASVIRDRPGCTMGRNNRKYTRH